MLFSEIPGLQAQKQRIINAINDGRVPHAQIYTGPEGGATLAMALGFVQYLFCEDRQKQDSCGKCSACKKVQHISHPDMLFSYPVVGADEIAMGMFTVWKKMLQTSPYFSSMQWAEVLTEESKGETKSLKQVNISAAECRDIVKKLSFKPYEAQQKVLIMWLPEYLGKEGNILLKIIEEPPPNTIILMVTESPDRVLNTIRSRTQLLKIPPFGDADVVSYLMKMEGISENVAQRIAFLSNGNMALALEHASAADSSSEGMEFLQWLRNCFTFRKSAGDILKWVDSTAALSREEQKAFLEYGLQLFRECLLMNNGMEAYIRLSAEEKEAYSKFFRFVNVHNAGELSELFSQAHSNIDRNANPKPLFLNLCISVYELLQMK